MATTTRFAAYTAVKQALGDWHQFTCEQGAAAGATLVAVKLAELAEANDAFPGWWTHISAGTGVVGDVRRVKGTGGYASSTGTITPTRAYTAQIPASATFDQIPSPNHMPKIGARITRGIELAALI